MCDSNAARKYDYRASISFLSHFLTTQLDKSQKVPKMLTFSRHFSQVRDVHLGKLGRLGLHGQNGLVRNLKAILL